MHKQHFQFLKRYKICFTWHAAAAEWQRNQKGQNSLPISLEHHLTSNLPNLSLLRWQVSQKDVIYTEINRCSIVSEMFLPRVISHLLLLCQPAQIKEACLEHTSSRVWGGVAWSCSLGLDTTDVSQIQKAKETRIFACGYHNQICYAGDIIEHSLHWNPWSLAPVYARGTDIYWPVQDNLNRPRSEILLWGETVAWQLTAWKCL